MSEMRRLVCLAAVVALALSGVGCGGRPDTLDMSGGPGPCGGAKPGDRVTVGIGHDVSQHQEQVRLMKDAWAGACHVAVDVRQLSPDTDMVRGTYVAAAQGRSPLRFDVVVADAVDIPELAALGYLRPVSVSAARLRVFPSAAVDTGRYGGALYALPFTLNTGLLYYRKDLIGHDPEIDPAGPWSGIATVCVPVRHRAHGGCLVTQLADYEGRTINALEAAWSTDAAGSGALFRPYTDVAAVHPDAAGAGLKRLAEATRGDGMIAPVSLRARERESIEAFGARHPQAVFMRNWPYVYDVLTNEFHLRPDKDFGVMPLPWPSVLGGESMAVTTTARNPDAAAALVRAMTGVDGWTIPGDRGPVLPPRDLFATGGMTVARTDVYGVPGGFRCTGVRRWTYRDAIVCSIRRARPRPVTPDYPAVSAAIRNTVGGWLGPGGTAVDPNALRTAIGDATGRR